MVGGQVLDLEAEGRIPATPASHASVTRQGDEVATLEGIHRRKTGALFRAALRLGHHAARGESDADPDKLAALDDYAAAFGLAFQITDDLLDVESSADKAGKRVGKDAARGKLTYPGLLGVFESRLRAEELAVAAMRAALRVGGDPDALIELALHVVRRDR
jgi:geranylgeranyl diphosphate synthase type II